MSGVLTAAKAVYEVRELIGGVGGRGTSPGAFHSWAVEELKRSSFVATALASIGARHKELKSVYLSLPPAWSTLYELSKAPDDVFRRALRRVTPDMERNEMTCLVADETEQPVSKKAMRQKGKQKKETRALPSPSAPEPRPREAANTSIMAGSVWRHVQDFEQYVDTALASGALSPEAKRFMVTNYLGPSREQITAMIEKLESTGV